SDKTIRVWDVETYQCQESLEGHLGWVWAIAFAQVTNAASHNQRLVSGSWDGALKIWETV
ncbi:MAG TPA: WD40 repeat domain-containing protein, partial [Elainellaceae cyanobacterium]